jgi:dienelactone hydrolase
MDAMVSIHGSFRDHPTGGGKSIKATRVLIEHGAEDVRAPLPEVDKIIAELRAAKTEFQFDLQRRRPRLFNAEEQGRGAGQPAVDRRDRAVPQGGVRALSGE